MSKVVVGRLVGSGERCLIVTDGLTRSVVQCRTTGVGSGVPEALNARTVAVCGPCQSSWISHVPLLQSIGSLASIRHSKREAVALPVIRRISLLSALAAGGAPSTTVLGAERSVVQCHDA